MPINNRRLKRVTFTIGGTDFACQLRSWKINNDTEDGETLYSYCPDGEDREETDDSYSLELSFFSDWKSAGVSEYLWANDKQRVAFVLDHHPDIVGEAQRFTGTVVIKAPSVGGEVRTTELTEVTLQIIGKPVKVRL